MCYHRGMDATPRPPPPRFLVLRAPPSLRADLDALARTRGVTTHRTALAALRRGVEQLQRADADVGGLGTPCTPAGELTAV